MSHSLKILHCLRAPVGGLFRHVRDLATEQTKRGHKVGILADAETSDSLTEHHLSALAPDLELGIHRTRIGRNPGLSDLKAVTFAKRLSQSLNIDVLHGHGAKGGALARLAGRSLKRHNTGVGVFYTPHGGSLHYSPNTIKGRIFLTLERSLTAATDGLIFECDFARTIYEDHIGKNLAATKIIHNGLHSHEFESLNFAPDAELSDFVFVGELRTLKGVDVLLRALAEINENDDATLKIAGDGPDGDQFKSLANGLGVNNRVSFLGAMPARKLFELGRILVMPSRKESFPYVVLEAGAAGLPMITTNVGGIPEIMQAVSATMVNPDDVGALARAMKTQRDNYQAAIAQAETLRERLRKNFMVDDMTTKVIDFYRQNRSH
ncbi:MAG: glycosyltransferase [Hyphomicrobiaceae bacterium]